MYESFMHNKQPSIIPSYSTFDLIVTKIRLKKAKRNKRCPLHSPWLSLECRCRVWLAQRVKVRGTENGNEVSLSKPWSCIINVICWEKEQRTIRIGFFRVQGNGAERVMIMLGNVRFQCRTRFTSFFFLSQKYEIEGLPKSIKIQC